MMNDYKTFIESKQQPWNGTPACQELPNLSAVLFPFQREIIAWALRKGRACIWADCGLGKTFMQLSWAQNIQGSVLIVCPLAVAEQTIREAAKMKCPKRIMYSRDGATLADGITVTNYEILQHFSPEHINAIVLDESSILKNFTGRIRNQIIDFSKEIPFKLACTATPAPNDFMELGNHAEFVGVMTRAEMLSKYFVHDGGSVQNWRIKGHAEDDFWKWVSNWALMIRKPSDIGHSDQGFELPPLTVKDEIIETVNAGLNDTLFPMEAVTLQERIRERRNTSADRCDHVSDLCKEGGPWIVWCNLNTESDTAEKLIDGAVQIKGSESPEAKTRKLVEFTEGKIRVLVTKPSIAGMGLNWQHCHDVVFLGLSDSWEQYYQAMRRCWRFGQKSPVTVHIVTASTEGQVVQNIKRKERDAAKMAHQLIKHMNPNESIHASERNADAYETDEEHSDQWNMYLGDCVLKAKELQDESIGFTVFSPPFASLYTYSASNHDMGNCANDAEFEEHFRYLIPELFRVTQPGRLLSVHCMNLPTSKAKDGVIGLRDFRGQMIKLFTDTGWIFHSEVCIWKDPVTAMRRTKALGLLWKQLKKDSAMSRQGIPDYLVTFRKPGANVNPIAHSPEEFPVAQWEKWASPIWDDINASETLQRESAREEKDERHICPLQLEVIRRAIRLWSNRGDMVLSPFAGIGSEGHVALYEERKFTGIELKRSYYTQACLNLAHAEQHSREMVLL